MPEIYAFCTKSIDRIYDFCDTVVSVKYRKEKITTFTHLFKFLFRVGFVVILLMTFIGQSFAQEVDLLADPYTRASQAIAIATANGHDVTISTPELGDVLNALENGDFIDNPVGVQVLFSASGAAGASGGTKRYTCSKTNWYAGHKLSINWWADARVSSGRIREVIHTDYNCEWVTWWPTFDAIVNATVTAHIQDSGRKIKLYIDGTVKYWFAGLPVSTCALNESCPKNV